MSLKIFIHLHHLKKFRRDRKGSATAVGAVFFFIITILLTTFMYEVAQKQISMQSYDEEKKNEQLDMTIKVTGGSVGFNITVDNNSPETIELIRLWIIDEDNNIHYNYSVPEGKRIVYPWDTVVISSSEIDGLGELVEGRHYLIRLVTSRGNIIEPQVFAAVPGNIVSTYVSNITGVLYVLNATGALKPSWLSEGQLEICRNSTETPVYNLSRDHDEVKPYNGEKVYISVKNNNNVTVFLTCESRIVFKSTSGQPQRCYAGRLTKWWEYRWDGHKWKMEGKGSIDLNKDSKAMYPNTVLILEFKRPQEAPGKDGNIPSGTYQVYLHLVGYDEQGKRFFRDIHYGTVSFTK